jgi:hypothetical protein
MMQLINRQINGTGCKRSTNDMKKHPKSLIVKEMQIKAALRFHLPSPQRVRMAIIKEMNNECWQDVEKKEPLHTVGWNANQCSSG